MKQTVNRSLKVHARVNEETKARLEKITLGSGLSESDITRMALFKFLPEVESGKLDVRKLLKKAA